MSRKNLSIAYWNAQSIQPKSNELSLLLYQYNVDICFISETWLKQNENFSMQGYIIYRKDRFCENPNKRIVGGGVAIAISSNISHTLLEDPKTTVIEAIGIKIEIDNVPTYFYSAYFSGSRLNKDKLANFEKDLITLTSTRKSYFICGDLNSKHRLWNCSRANRAGQILYNRLSSMSFTINFPPSPTYFPPQSNRTLPSTIDVVLTNGYKEVVNIRTVNELSSDHVPVLFEVELNGKSNPPLPCSKRCYSKADWCKFKDIIQNHIDLRFIGNRLNSKDDIDDVLASFNKCIKDAEDASIPMEIQSRLKSSAPDPTVSRLISVRNYKRRQWQRTRLPYLKNEVNSLSRLIRKHIDMVKNVEWHNRLSKIPPKSNQLWKVTKLLKNKSRRFPPLKDSLGRLQLTDIEKAKCIGEAFAKAHFTTFNDRSSADTEFKVDSAYHNVNYFLPQVAESAMPTPKEIRQFIRKLKVKKSPGNDGISNLLLKHLPEKGIMLLMYVLRACLRLSYFPDKWKVAKVIPIPKPGKDQSDPSNYRPISLLCSISKIFEKVILSRLNDHISKCDIIPNEQFGFRPGHSTNHQLLRVCRFIKDSLSNKYSAGILTFDIEKAFDSIWHRGLIYKMLKLNFPLYLVKLVNSFLSRRSFFVSIQGKDSPLHRIVAGLPQGSVLSPTLFNVFMSDLSITASDKGLFADDTAVFCANKSPNKIVKKLNSASKQLSDFCSKWKIKLNPGKTQAAYFTRRKADRWLPSSQIRVLNAEISWDNEIKYLGVTLDKTLNFKRHTDYAAEKALKFYGILYSLLNRKSRLSQINKIVTYNAMIRSILLYACPVWGNCAKSHINKLQLVQNKCLRSILKVQYNHPICDLHDRANLPPLVQQIQKITHKFVSRLPLSVNPLIRALC